MKVGKGAFVTYWPTYLPTYLHLARVRLRLLLGADHVNGILPYKSAPIVRFNHVEDVHLPSNSYIDAGYL